MSDNYTYKIKATITRLEVCSSSQGFKFWIKGTKNYYAEIADLEGIESLAGGKDERNIFVKNYNENSSKNETEDARLCKLNVPISCYLNSNNNFFNLIKDASINNCEILLTTTIEIENNNNKIKNIKLKGITLVGNNHA